MAMQLIATAVSLDDASGLVILNPGADKQTAGGVPEFYSTLLKLSV